MKFTIVTSFYNGERFIPVLYEKIKNQTYTNWEWIVTDDFSKDNSKNILIDIVNRDRKVKYVEQNYKKEMFYNPQRFCRNAEIIVQADQDDYPLPKALEAYQHFFTKFPDTRIITCAANMFAESEGGSWMNFYNPDYSKVNNMSCGYLTCLRAWRNNPNELYDFNPNNWMNYYYNDLSIICTLEESGKILNLPRDLYYYNYRPDSISHTVNPDDSIKEGEDLINIINSRRYDKNIDTLNRYFETIHNESLCLMDHNVNNVSTQQKIAYIDKNISPKKCVLLKELFFDHDLNINKIDKNEDSLVFVIRDLEDLDNFLSDSFDNIKRVQVVVWEQKSNPNTDLILQKITTKYSSYYYHIAHHTIVNLIK